MYGAQLLEALRELFSECVETSVHAGSVEWSSANPSRDAEPEFFGVGGEKMRAAGCELIIDAKDLSVVGITEILSHLPKIWRLFHKLIAEAGKRRPDLAIIIDSPAFNWRVAREMKKRGVPVVYYVCPQFWAWRQGRVRLLRKYVDKGLVIFPFEEKFYRDRGIDAEFVGHPLAEIPRPAISRDQYASQYGLDTSKSWITLMPGSRRKEVRMNLPGILKAAAMLGDEYEFLLPIAPTLDRSFVQDLVVGVADAGVGPGARARAGGLRSPSDLVRPALVPRLTHIHLVPDALPALAHSRAGIIASGTATVEAAMMETPFVMVYRVTPLTYLLGRWTVKVPHFAMVNLIAEEEVVPELVQDDFTPDNVLAELKQIIPDGAPRQKMIEGLQNVKRRLRGDQTEGAANRAAKIICRQFETMVQPT